MSCIKYFLALSSFAVLSCRASNSADVKYSTDAVLIQNSYLADIERTKRIDICIAQGSGRGGDSVSNEAILNSLSSAMSIWKDLIQRNGDFKSNPMSVSVQILSKESCLALPRNVVKIFYYYTQEIQESCRREWGQSYSPTACRSFALPSKREIHLDSNSIVDPDGFVVLHEFGHILGLGDTYVDVNREKQLVEGQPDSVMNGLSHTPTTDDFRGLIAVWEAHKAGATSTQEICGVGYGAKAVDKFSRVYCVPTDPNLKNIAIAKKEHPTSVSQSCDRWINDTEGIIARSQPKVTNEGDSNDNYIETLRGCHKLCLISVEANSEFAKVSYLNGQKTAWLARKFMKTARPNASHCTGE